LFEERLAWRATETAWRPDGEWLSFFWKEPDGAKSLRAVASATGAPVWSVDFSELVPEGESEAIEPEAQVWAPGGEALLLVAADDLFLYRFADRKLRRLTRGEAAEETPAFSPEGGRVAFVRAADLWVLDLASGRESRLTHDGAPDEILNGTTDWVYWEEIWNREKAGFWWSPTGRALAFYRFDLRAVERYPLLDEREVYPTVRWQRYPKAGARNAAVQVGVVELGTGAVTWLETGDAEASYLARVHWSPPGGHLAIERLSRDQTTLDLLLCTASTGHCRNWSSQQSPTWVNLGDDFRFLSDGGFLWSHEETGWRRLERHDPLGRRERRLGPDGWAIAGLEALLGDGEAVVVT
ncbi:MAG: DPP IV N-terminal domain-containing protein, partial [Thermoanaerobaculia bacterium]|nr:DPP IV N-terminal domain-containing protein [Thermoanaerobaculia bacterium]